MSSLTNVASAILWQLTEWLPGVVGEAMPQMRPGQKRLKSVQNYGSKDLCDLIDTALRRLAECDAVIVAIDALDEYLFPPCGDDFLRILERLLSEPLPQLRLKLLLSTRSNFFDAIVRSHPGLQVREGSNSVKVASENSPWIRS